MEMDEKNRKIIIGGIIVVAIIAIIAVVIMREPADKTPFEADETIEVEFCRQFITRAQLSKITGEREKAFIFEYSVI
jgi:hypothetical protein